MNNILQKIDSLCEQKGWSKYKLAERSSITLSTMNAWYKNDYTPKIESLERMCGAFGITLSQFFADEDESFSLTENQRRLVKQSVRLSGEQLEAVIHLLEKMNEQL